MSVNAVSTAFFNSQSSADLRRVQAELADLQRQVGSEHKADDLKGYGIASTRILNAKAMIERSDARQQAANTLGGRLGAVDGALEGVSDATESLRQAVLTALGQDDGRYLTTSLQAAFDHRTPSRRDIRQGLFPLLGRHALQPQQRSIDDLPG